MKLQNIKLIIWDLDETFWNGTISEGDIKLIPDHVKFLRDTTDIGIVNSICSKNDFNVVKKCLENENLWNCFVFCSIDWSPKGQRIKNIIDTMKLRAVNVLFIDDNVQNLEEAKHFCDGIMTALPHEIFALIEEARNAEKKDLHHKRLAQYKQLEEKEEARTEFSSNEDFLVSCRIKVDICCDCENEVDRIHELIMRSNQLNYTKFRQDKVGLNEIIRDKNVNTGYVRASDKFGDYGIVGFFAVKDNKLLHFVFSCRTLGMKIEQYVYYLLGCPVIDTVGEVVSKLNSTENPYWINQDGGDDEDSEISQNLSSCNILFKGPCDMSQMYAFLNLDKTAVTEFTYTNSNGISVEGHNHTSQIVTSLYSDKSRKLKIISDFAFFDKDMLSTALETQKFDFVVLSMLTDGNLGIYRRKETGEEIALCEKKNRLTDVKNREKYINGEVFNSYISFTNDILEKFEEEYSFVDNSDADITVRNLQKIWEFIGKNTKLILLLGSEREFKKKCNESYAGRHIEHAVMNSKIIEWANDKTNVILLPFDNYIKSEHDFIDTINHFVKRVYYELACDLAKIFADGTETVKVKGKKTLLKATVRQKLQILKKRLLS